MLVALLSAIPATLLAIAGLLTALSGRREARVKASRNEAVQPIEVTAAALKIANEWIDKLARELKNTEDECDRRIKELEARIRDLENRLWTTGLSDPRAM